MTGPLTLSNSTCTITGGSGGYGLFVSSGVSLSGALYTYGNNVGIGGTNPSYKFYVNGTVRSLANYVNSLYSYGTGTITDTLTLIGTDPDFIVGVSTFVVKNGLVGIGNPNPSTKLHLSSGTITLDGTNAPTVGGALCLNTAGAMSKCTTVVDASGNCTCP
jgi:hypothetical protein